MSIAAERSRGDDTPPRCVARGVFWLTDDGRYAPARCGRSNSCPYCAYLASRENVAVVALDARDRQPTVGITLTTHRADFDMATFRVGTANVFRRLRREFGREVEYLGLMEWTTGKRTPGRRPHMHALVKGLDPALAPQAHGAVRETWEKSTRGSWVVDCRELRTPGGAIAYVVGHHHKSEQAPPAGWSGKRVRPSQGYFERPVAQLRSEARAVLRTEIARAKLGEDLDAAGLSPDELGDAYDELLQAAKNEPTPRLVRVRHDDGALVDVVTGEVVPDPKERQQHVPA